MTDEEVNKIIAEFMGWCESSDYHVTREMKPFTQSLDALVPVWEKISLSIRIEIGYYKDFAPNKWAVELEQCFSRISFNQNKTVYQAAAHATAKAILELKDD